ncbi:MAG: 50S ribosomal protein L4 [Patescibacteria group bacterium]
MATVKKTVAKKAPAKKTAPKKAVEAASAPKAEKKVVSASEATIYTMAGASAGTIALPAELFAQPWKADLVHQVVVGMQANARPTIAHTKFRGEVSGGGKKPWKQKGTGRARHGSNRSPIWKGGGVTHGPRAEKIYAVKINRKMRAAALASVLSRKWRDGEIVFVDSLSLGKPATKDAKNALIAIANASGMQGLVTKRKNAAVVALSQKDANIEKSFRNMGHLMTEEVRNLNPVDLMNKKFLVIENPVVSLPVLSARLSK